MANNLAARNNLGRIIYTPSFLIIFSTARNIIALHHWSVASLEDYHYLLQSLPILIVCFSTFFIWQCYFANSVASAQTFYSKWRNFATWQRWLFGAAGLLLLLVTLAVGVGLLQVTDGPNPSSLLQVGILTPAVLWIIPVVLSATLTIFGINGNGPVEQMRERALAHIAHLILYFVFLRSSQLDALLGAENVSVCVMFGMTFLGFGLQLLWHLYPYMPIVLPYVRVAYPQQEQGQGRGELVTGASHQRLFAMDIEEPNALLVVGVRNALPPLNDNDKLVIN